MGPCVLSVYSGHVAFISKSNQINNDYIKIDSVYLSCIILYYRPIRTYVTKKRFFYIIFMRFTKAIILFSFGGFSI